MKPHEASCTMVVLICWGDCIKCSEHVLLMQLTVLPAVEDLQTDEATRARWIDYSAYDAKATWQLTQALRKELKVGSYQLLECTLDSSECFEAYNWSRPMLCLHYTFVVRSIVACSSQQWWQGCVQLVVSSCAVVLTVCANMVATDPVHKLLRWFLLCHDLPSASNIFARMVSVVGEAMRDGRKSAACCAASNWFEE